MDININKIKSSVSADMRVITNDYGLPNPMDLSAQDVQNYVPSVIETTPRGERSFDLFSRLLRERIIFLTSEVNDVVSSIVVGQLLLLDSEDATKDIYFYINSPGGSVYAGLGIYDTMQYIAPDVATICTGMAASMGAVLMCAGASGKRTALKHSRVMIHQPLGGAQGQATDMEITVKEIIKLKKELYEIIAQHSGQKFNKVEKDSERDFWMTAQEAKEYGMIDEVLIRK